MHAFSVGILNYLQYDFDYSFQYPPILYISSALDFFQPRDYRVVFFIQ